MNGFIFDIKRFSVNDGPGIRTNFSLKAVRVAGYSDYFNDLTPELQEEIITRTEHGEF